MVVPRQPRPYEAVVTDHNSAASKEPKTRTQLNSSIDTNSPCFRPVSKLDIQKELDDSKRSYQDHQPTKFSSRKGSFNRNYKTKPLTLA